MPRIKRIITLAAILTATAAWTPGITGAIPIGSGVESSSSPTPGDLSAAERAATHMSASLDRFGLVHIHAISSPPGSVIITSSDPEGFQFGDAAIGAGATQLHVDHSHTPGAYSCGINYSMNSVDGKYCPPRYATPIASLPPASAAALRSEQTSSVVRPNADQQTPASTRVTIVRVSTPTSRFDWGDAGIGAAGGFALSMLALGLALVLSQHRARRTNRPAATAG